MLILSASQLALQQRLPKMIAVSTQNVNFIIVSKKLSLIAVKLYYEILVSLSSSKKSVAKTEHLR